MITPLPADPHYISFLKPILFMASDSSSGFQQGYHTFLYGHIKYNREGGRKKMNEQTRTWVSVKRKKGIFVTLCILHASVDYRWRVCCAELLQKPVGMPTNLWLSSFTASCWLSFPWIAISHLTGLFYSLLSTASLLCLLWDLPAYCWLSFPWIAISHLTGLFYSLLSTASLLLLLSTPLCLLWDLPFLVHLQFSCQKYFYFKLFDLVKQF